MKKLFAIALLASFTTLAAPLQWTCDWPEAKSQTFSLYQGETATFEPTFRVNGRTVTNATIEAVWYQTNGMDNAWWKLDGATFAPSNDVGAAAYRFFVEASVPGSPFPVPQTIYRANGALRMLPSPGFTPNAIEPPIVALDFSTIEVANAPYYDKAETEAKIVELAPAPDYSTNNAELVETIHQTEVDPTVPAWAKKDLSTMYSQDLYRILNIDFYAKDSSIKSQNTIWLKGDSNPTVTVGRDKLTDNTFPYARQTVRGFSAYEGFDYYAHYRPRGIYIWPWWNEDAEDDIEYLFPTNGNGGTFALTSDIAGKQDKLPYPTNAIPYAAISGKPSLATVATSGNYNDLSNKPTIPTVPTNVSAFNNDAGYLTSYTESDPTIKSWAKASTKPTYTASEVGAATAEDVYRIVAGTNVLLIVTNYNSAVHAPAMKLQHLDPESGQYVTYWDEQRRHGMTLTNAMDYTDAAAAAELSRADAAYAPRAWSGTTSGLGAEAPAGVTWISTPETVIAGGYEYEKVITSAGAVWVLSSNGLTTGATTNSFFRISASDGTELFSIEKTDSYLIGVNADGITKSGNTVTIPLNVVANAHPFIRATTNLVDAVWVKEDENGFNCPFASVSWSGSSGAYVATVTCSQPQAFFYFEYMVEGVAKIKNSAKTEMTGGIIFNGTTYMPTVSGNELKFIAQ